MPRSPLRTCLPNLSFDARDPATRAVSDPCVAMSRQLLMLWSWERDIAARRSAYTPPREERVPHALLRALEGLMQILAPSVSRFGAPLVSLSRHRCHPK